MAVSGHYFSQGSALLVPARLEEALDSECLTVRDVEGTVLAQAARADITASSRLGKLRRRLDFPQGGRFETDDNDGIDLLLGQGSGVLHRLEQSWPIVLVSVLAAGAAAAWFIFYGMPVAALWMAQKTPPGVATYVSNQTLETLEGRLLKQTKLSAERQAHFRILFAQVAAEEPRGPGGYRLLMRDAPIIGPNAFALPDGSIVLTDQLVHLIAADDELRGIFGHEMAHVNRGHVLQRIYQAALVPAAIAAITGDATQVGHIATIAPGIILQSAYSRSFEQQADDDAADTLRHMDRNPAALASLLTRLDRELCGKDGCGPSWLGSHPASAERAARLRKAR